LVVTTALFDAISGAPRVRNQLLRVVKKSQNRVFQLRIREDGLGNRRIVNVRTTLRFNRVADWGVNCRRVPEGNSRLTAMQVDTSGDDAWSIY
jgi:hypothetical protein